MTFEAGQLVVYRRSSFKPSKAIGIVIEMRDEICWSRVLFENGHIVWYKYDELDKWLEHA